MNIRIISNFFLAVMLTMTMIVSALIPSGMVYASVQSPTCISNEPASKNDISVISADEYAQALLNGKIQPVNEDPQSPLYIEFKNDLAKAEHLSVQNEIIDVRKIGVNEGEEEYQATIIFVDDIPKITPFNESVESGTYSGMKLVASITYTKKILKVTASSKKTGYRITNATAKLTPTRSIYSPKNLYFYSKALGDRCNSNGTEIAGGSEKKKSGTVTSVKSGKLYSFSTGQKYWYFPRILDSYTYVDIHWSTYNKTIKKFSPRTVKIGWN